MQLALKQGRTLEGIWQATAEQADVEGLSVRQRWLATHLLTQCWGEHGMALRVLHNAYWGSPVIDTTVKPGRSAVDFTGWHAWWRRPH